MRNVAMQPFSETKRCSQDRPKKKRRSNGNDTMHFLDAKGVRDDEIHKKSLEIKQKSQNEIAKQTVLMMPQQQYMMKNF